MQKQPNILIILSDQLRRNVLGVYGDTNISTPHIDKLAKQGVCFNNACSTYPLCVPFRYTLMTGNYAHTCMIPTLGWRMSPAERTLADEFNDHGYETSYFGKWHLYGGQINVKGFSGKEENNKPVPRSHQGRWQHWRGFDVCNNPFATNYYVDDDPTPHKINGYQTDGLFGMAIDFLGKQRNKSKPFCCVVSVEPPHNPFEAPEKLEKKWLPREISLPDNFMIREDDHISVNHNNNIIDDSTRDEVIRNRKIYYAMVENLDENIGKMVSFLKRENLLDDTIIIFMSDHGELGGAHSLMRKQYPYEESIGIPLIISGSTVPQNKQINLPLSSEDLFPTILGLSGVEPHRHCHGCDLSQVVYSAQDKMDRPGVLLQFIWEPRSDVAFEGQIWRGFRSERYKYTVLGDFERGLQPWQFFDLGNDPYELNNLINNEGFNEQILQHHKWMSQKMLDVGDEAVFLL